MRELCKAAGIPLQQDRMAQTSNALSARAAIATVEPPVVNQGIGVQTKVDPIPPIVLTPKQSLRVYTMSHLEDGKNPSKIIDELLDADAERRKGFDLSLPDVKLVRDFRESARS